jgi:hypothetical protein
VISDEGLDIDEKVTAAPKVISGEGLDTDEKVAVALSSSPSSMHRDSSIVDPIVTDSEARRLLGFSDYSLAGIHNITSAALVALNLSPDDDEAPETGGSLHQMAVVRDKLGSEQTAGNKVADKNLKNRKAMVADKKVASAEEGESEDISMPIGKGLQMKDGGLAVKDEGLPTNAASVLQKLLYARPSEDTAAWMPQVKERDSAKMAKRDSVTTPSESGSEGSSQMSDYVSKRVRSATESAGNLRQIRMNYVRGDKNEQAWESTSALKKL